MEGVSIPGVELLRPGKWNGRQYTLRDLDDMVASFQSLRGVFRPYGKLGHNPEQELIASDGLPACGWITNLYRTGTKLVGDFTDVPGKVAELIKAHAYRGRSCEILFNSEIEGTTYPAVLKAVAWLGADLPAVRGLDDIVAMYTDSDDRQVTIATLSADEETFDTIRMAVAEALRDTYPYRANPYGDPDDVGGSDDDEEGPSPSIRDLYLDRVIVSDQDGDALWQIPYTMAANGDVTLGEPSLVKVQYVAVPDADTSEEADDDDQAQLSEAIAKVVANAISVKAGEPLKVDGKPVESAVLAREHSAPRASKQGVETMEDQDIRNLLSLEDGADVRVALLQMRASHVSLSDHQAQLSQRDTEIAELRHQVNGRDASERVEKLITSGRLVPKLREWGQALCLSDPSSFEHLEQNAPVVLNMTETGRNPAPGEPGETSDEPTKLELDVAKAVGVNPERLKHRVPWEEQLAEKARARELART